MGKSLIQQARGKGGPRYRVPSFRFKGEGRLLLTKEPLKGKITDFVKCAGHSAPLAEIEYSNGETCLMIAPEGVKIGDEITANTPAEEVKPGMILALKDIPEGTPIFNIESQPGDGGKFCRSSGVCGRVLAKTPTSITVMLPSKKEKTFNADCRAAIGIVAGGARTEKPFLKAGKRHFWKKARNKRYPNPSAAAQNAVDHPFGNKRTSRKAKQKPAPRYAPPGRKVGKLHPRRTGRK